MTTIDDIDDIEPAEAFRSATKKAANTLVELLDSDDDHVRLTAAMAVLDRHLGSLSTTQHHVQASIAILNHHINVMAAMAYMEEHLGIPRDPTLESERLIGLFRLASMLRATADAKGAFA